MAQYYRDFSETIDALDHEVDFSCLEPGETAYSRGFFRPWTANDNDWTVVTFDGKTVIKHYVTVAARRVCLWASGGVFADVEALGCVYVTSTSLKSSGLILRAKGTAAQEYGYRFVTYTGPKIVIGRYSAGVYSVLKDGAYVFNTGWYWIRAQAIGGNLKMRIWADGAAEPETWNLEVADGSPLD